jgi:hypothetical protein
MPLPGAKSMLADLSDRDRIVEKARDGRGLAVIWEIPVNWEGGGYDGFLTNTIC